ncbi:SPOR domain-containing protein [Ectothiorhodospiraceae bacterium 2226]|nr:SPOR domain-containing protein [Ectothiorhodospiraceae bacterium 2226]
MARDYAKKPASRRTRTGTPGWVWLSAGLAIGLFVAFLIYLQGTGPRNASETTTTQTPAQAPAGGSQEARGVRKSPAPTAPEPPASEPRFDFYRILPEMEATRVEPPDSRPRPTQTEAPETTARARQPEELQPSAPAGRLAPGSYVLQVGAFRQFEEADRLKANLALLGVEATIQTVRAANDETWHRVRVGPLSDLQRLETIRSRLKDNQIEAMLLKVST